MKAIVCPRYGSPDVLELRDVPKPVPAANQVLVRIAAAGLNAADWRMVRADPFLVRLNMGLARPRIKGPGSDMAGTVEAMGPGVSRFKPGDEVIADLFPAGFGGCAEYTCVPHGLLALKPKSMSFEEAATLPLAGGTAVRALRDMGRVGPGARVVIAGASGGVGIFAVQIAKALGAEVTAVCSAGKAEQARALGADFVVDYGREDFTRSGQRYDVIIAVNGYIPIRRYRDALRPGRAIPDGRRQEQAAGRGVAARPVPGLAGQDTRSRQREARDGEDRIPHAPRRRGQGEGGHRPRLSAGGDRAGAAGARAGARQGQDRHPRGWVSAKEDPMDHKTLIDALELGPRLLAELVSAIPEPALNRKRGEGYWTIFEHLLHLVETQEVLMARLEMFRDQPNPVITPYTPTRVAGKGTPTAAGLVEAFARWREKQVRLIRGVSDDVWRRTAVHPEYESYGFELLVRHIALHDGFHLARIEDLWLLKDGSLTPMT